VAGDEQHQAEGDEGDEPRLGLDPAARLCGNCRLWRAIERDAAGIWLGDCRVMPQRGQFPPTAPICASFISRSQAIPQALPEEERHRRARTVGAVGPKIVRHHEPHEASPRAQDAVQRSVQSDIQPDIELGDFDMTREELKAVIREAVIDLGSKDIALAGKWEGGTVLLKPGNPTLQSKELPIDALFHKVVMVRDRLRVLEQKVNGHPKLSDADKVEMQQYVTRCYGSLTTFNVLFADKRDHFVGDKSGD
jgi:hypothetical protein